MEKTDKEIVEFLLSKSNIEFRYTTTSDIETEELVFTFDWTDNLINVVAKEKK